MSFVGDCVCVCTDVLFLLWCLCIAQQSAKYVHGDAGSAHEINHCSKFCKDQLMLFCITLLTLTGVDQLLLC